jgi:hypothetical protein
MSRWHRTLSLEAVFSNVENAAWQGSTQRRLSELVAMPENSATRVVAIFVGRRIVHGPWLIR